jgi:hypothetical protein
VLWDALRVVVALVAIVVLYLVAAGMIRNFARAEPPPSEPDLGRLEDVDYRYACVVCGAQVVLFASPGGEPPEAPRHCREPMALVTPIDDNG